MASDVIRDGMALELTDLDQPCGQGPSLEVFYSDAHGTFTFSSLGAVDLPLDLLTRFIDTARQSLAPDPDSTD